MSRHNRRRRRSHRTNHRNQPPCWNEYISGDSISSIASTSSIATRATDYPLFYCPNGGNNPWVNHLPNDTGIEYLWRRGIPLPPGLPKQRSISHFAMQSATPAIFHSSSTWTPAVPVYQSSASWRGHVDNSEHFEEVPSETNVDDDMSETMFRVVNFLFRDDDEDMANINPTVSNRWAYGAAMS
ncbi:hypothetical protein BT63DRAFT_160344 [Microthyrium microscopicum]|uniref:Uncharacterized protein n=1 Tax=Microthyrium microscopicum TaxID=703497 RepID=A0A6A6UQA5_9PEZI|nr:hypothetical protein BT63DRAFT_160344 [Microthyrium microscopicum]